MATNTTELVQEVRQFTGYTSTNTFSDSDIENLIDIGKEELRSNFNDPDFTFFQTGGDSTHDADRALFWFTCIATKVRAGEIGGINITLNDFRSTTADEAEYDFWLDQFQKKVATAESALSSSSAIRSISRTDREYSYDQPS